MTAEKGGLCLFLNEERCFYANQSCLVRDTVQKLSERASESDNNYQNPGATGPRYGTGHPGYFP